MIFQNAKPVWIKGKERILNVSLAFVAEFGACEDAELVITASNRYSAYLNGKFIAFGPARAAHGFFRADRIKLGKTKGGLLFVIACGYNTINFQSSDHSAFLQAEIFDGERSVISTGKDFLVREYTEKLRKVSRLSFQRSFSECYKFSRTPSREFSGEFDRSAFFSPDEAEGGIVEERHTGYAKYDERASCPVESGTFYDGGGKIERDRAAVLEAIRIYPVSELDSNPADTVCRLKYERYPCKAGIPKEIGKGEYILYDFGQSETGFIKVNFEAKEDSLIWFIFDEINMNPDPNGTADVRFSRNSCINIIEYNVKKGEYLHQTYEPYTARYVKAIVAEGRASFDFVKIVSFENPDAGKFSLKCADKRLEKIVSSAVRTFAHNAVDILMDCPSRERAGWLCDSFFSARSEQLFTGDNRVERDFLENFAKAPEIKNVPHGMVPMCYPADFTEESYIPNWSMWYIIELYDRYLRTGDEYIRSVSRDKVEDVIGFFDKYINGDGLLEDLENWVFVEWSKANDPEFTKGVSYPSNMLFAMALDAAGKLYGIGSYLERGRMIREKIREQSFNGEFFEDNAVRENGKLTRKGHITETCQYYAFFTGTATAEEYPELFRTMTECFGEKRNAEEVYPQVFKSNAFVGNYLRLIMLADNGKKERLSGECFDFFYKMALSTGTLWENDSPYGSLNHCFASYAAVLIVDYLCGFKGVHGNRILLSEGASAADCEIRIPVGKGEFRFERKEGREVTVLPEGYIAVRGEEA